MKIRRDLSEPEIPTASMADIAFMLIIFFIFTTVFAMTKGMSFEQPKPDDGPAEEVPKASIHIVIKADNSLLVDGEPTTLAGLLATLKPKLELEKDKPVIVQPDPDRDVDFRIVLGYNYHSCTYR